MQPIEIARSHRLSVTAAALGVLVMSFGGSPPARAESRHACNCQAAVLSGHSQFDAAANGYAGQGFLELDGKRYPVDWLSVISSSVEGPNGTLLLTGSHHITSVRDRANIDFTTSDGVVAVPTGVEGEYVFSSHLTIKSGTGRVRSGFLDVTGRVNLIAGSVMIDSSTGRLCSDG